MICWRQFTPERISPAERPSFVGDIFDDDCGDDYGDHDDIYYDEVSVCVSRKMITSSFESPVTRYHLKPRYHGFTVPDWFLMVPGWSLCFLWFQASFHGSRWVFIVFHGFG